MRYKSKIYAKAIVDLILEKSTRPGLVDKFLKLLQKNGDMKKAKEIVLLAENLYFKKIGKRKIILEVARKIKNLENLFAKKNDIVEEKVNSELIAGVKLIVNGERQLDYSLQRKLQEIF